ncbi:MAG: serine/threonine-protein kinase [Lachnospiraceae bacterium]|nr:serine/threonine-protein kinase [Lachnospiraceae bacterium]
METIGKYRILGKIGQGGSSSVYLVTDDRIDKKWAIKAIPKSLAQKDGILLLRTLDHPSLPRIVEEMESSSSFFEVMDYFEGQALDEWCQKGISFSDALRISGEILETAAYLHGQSPPVIHRDIKPANFIITSDGRAKLVDFDLAVSGERQGLLPMGTRGYAPPEQYRGICSMRGDVYAIGKTLSFLFSRVLPRSISPLDRPVLKRAYAVCEKAASDQPERRYANAGDMYEAFGKCIRLKKSFRPILAGSIAAILFLILLLSGHSVLRDALAENYRRTVTRNFANASSLLSESIHPDLDSAYEAAKKSDELIRSTKHLLAALPPEDKAALTDQYYALHHSALVIMGSTAETESSRAEAYRTCILDDLEYEEHLKTNGRTAELFSLYLNNAALSKIIGDTGSEQRYYEKALALPGIPKEERSRLMRAVPSLGL